MPARPDAGLPRELGLTGAPRIGFFAADGQLLLEVPPAVHTVARFASFAAQTRELLALRAGAAHGDPRAQAGLLIFGIEHRQVTHRAALTERARLQDETPAERQRLDGLLLDMDIGERILAAGQDRAKRRQVGGEFLAMLRAGTRPTADVTRGFWFVILEHAEAQRDAPAYETALAGLRSQLMRTDPDATWARTLLESHTQVLERLRGLGAAQDPGPRGAPDPGARR